jgi:subtilisin-like proprotein convertase family protein
MPAADLSVLEVVVLADHRYTGDVSMYLDAPDGDSIALIRSDASGCSGNDIMTVFTLSADSTISQDCGLNHNLMPFSPAIQPEESLTGVMPGDPNGNWILKISDDYSGQSGYFHAWGLRMLGSAGVEPVVQNALHTYNFPNPFSEVTTIYFELPQSGDVQLTVFDQSGRVVMQRPIGNAAKGSNTYQLNIGGLASGIYHYELRSGDHRAVNKMVVSK